MSLDSSWAPHSSKRLNEVLDPVDLHTCSILQCNDPSKALYTLHQLSAPLLVRPLPSVVLKSNLQYIIYHDLRWFSFVSWCLLQLEWLRRMCKEGQLQSAPVVGHCDQARLLSSYLSREWHWSLFLLWTFLSISTDDRRPACFEVQRKMALLHCALVSPRTHGEWQTAPGDGRAPFSVNSCVFVQTWSDKRVPDHGETAFTVRCLKSQTCCDPDLVRRYLTANGYLSTFVAAFYIALDKNKSQVTKEGFNYLSLSLYIYTSISHWAFCHSQAKTLW